MSETNEVETQLSKEKELQLSGHRKFVVSVAVLLCALLFLYTAYQPYVGEVNLEGSEHTPSGITQIEDTTLDPIVEYSEGIVIALTFPIIIFLIVLLLALPAFVFAISTIGFLLSLREDEDGWYHYTGAFVFSTAYPPLGILLVFPDSPQAETVMYLLVLAAVFLHSVLVKAKSEGAAWKSAPMIYTTVLVMTTPGFLT